MRLLRPLPLALLALASLGAGASLTPRPAEACSYAPPKTAAIRPAAGETGVPTNARIWLTGAGLAEVALHGGDGAVAVEVTQLKLYPTWAGALYRITPAAPLAPDTRYTVTVTGQGEAATSFSFTSGAGPQDKAPDGPTALSASARETYGNSCYDGHPYAVTVTTDAVAGAALYELQVSQDDGETFATVLYAATPRLETVADALPTPLYRVRPLAITGVGAAEPSLPLAEVADERTQGDRDRIGEPVKPPEPKKGGGGCAATDVGGSTPSLLLAMAVLGWAQWQRRRRGARSLADLGLG